MIDTFSFRCGFVMGVIFSISIMYLITIIWRGKIMTDKYLKDTFYKNMSSFKCTVCGGELKNIWVNEKEQNKIEGLFECKDCGQSIAKKYEYNDEHLKKVKEWLNIVMIVNIKKV